MMLCLLATPAFLPLPDALPPLHSPPRMVAARSPLMVATSTDERMLNAIRALNKAEKQSRSIRCPFWRRRAAEMLEPLLVVARFIAARHKSLDLLPAELLPVRPSGLKVASLSLEAAMEAVRRDIEDRQYYVTGQLNSSIYSDTCFFDGPDPDMPVRSLVRYRDALHG